MLGGDRPPSVGIRSVAIRWPDLSGALLIRWPGFPPSAHRSQVLLIAIQAVSRAQQLPLEHERQEKIAIAVRVEQHRQLVAVVALDGAFSPAVAQHACAHIERARCAVGCDTPVMSLSHRPQGPW